MRDSRSWRLTWTRKKGKRFAYVAHARDRAIARENQGHTRFQLAFKRRHSHAPARRVMRVR